MKNLGRCTVAIVVASLLVATAAYASEELAKKEDLRCTVCHVKKGSKLLTNKGLYYELKGTMQDYDLVIRVYKKCTACHVREPGSKTLTTKGEALRGKGVTMEHYGKPAPKK